jgi:hypothetical protein
MTGNEYISEEKGVTEAPLVLLQAPNGHYACGYAGYRKVP